MRKRGRSQESHQLLDPDRTYYGRVDVTQWVALQSVGAVLYACRVGETIKIGFTTNLGMRLTQLRASELLAFTPGSVDDEKAIHASLSDDLDHGREWYKPSDRVMALVNSWREGIGLDLLGPDDFHGTPVRSNNARSETRGGRR